MACSVVKFTFTFLFLVVTTVCIVRGCRCDGHVLLYLRVMCTHCTRSPYEHCMSWLARYSRWDFLKGTAEVHHIRYNHSWFQTFAVFWMLFAFFWVIPRCLNFICWRFGALCLFHLHRQVGVHLPAYDDGKEYSETSAYKIQTPGNYPEEGKGKAVPLQAWSGPEGSRKLRLPDFMTTAQGGGKVVSFTHRLHLPTGNPPCTHFC